jgi:hypothetical protein
VSFPESCDMHLLSLDRLCHTLSLWPSAAEVATPFHQVAEHYFELHFASSGFCQASQINVDSSQALHMPGQAHLLGHFNTAAHDSMPVQND